MSDNITGASNNRNYKVEDAQNLEKEFIEDLKTNPRYKSFFDEYHPANIESFINYYAKRKAFWLINGKIAVSNKEYYLLRYANKAEERLWDIQQKKLFDLQCKWRAELITLPGIECTTDFKYWECNIHKCPYISSIEEEEFLLYKQYIISDNFHPFNWIYDDWQDYRQVKEAYLKEEDFFTRIPDWYLFYYQHNGTSELLHLPDIRGEKEYFYSELTRKERSRIYLLEHPHPPAPSDPRPILHTNDEHFERFIKKFEDSRLLSYFNAIEKDKSDYRDELEDYIDILEHAGLKYPIEAGNGWFETLERTANRFVKESIYNELDAAYGTYLNKIKLGIPFNPVISEKEVEIRMRYGFYTKEDVIEGRKLNGEPGDFNF